MKNILTLTLLASLLCVSTYAECTRNSNETVTCSESKLIWQDNSEVKTIKKSWSYAIKHCEDLNFAGYSDWRLPNINELLSIVDESKYNNRNGAFKNVAGSAVWSSTSYARNTNNAWYISPGTQEDNKNIRKYVRCVRAGQ